MNKSKTQMFLFSVNDLGQKVYTSQADPSQSFVLDEEGNMVKYHPEMSIFAINLQEYEKLDENSVDSSIQSNNPCISHTESQSRPGVNTIDEIIDLEDNSRDSLNSDNIMRDSKSHYISQHLDIREPLSKLRRSIEEKLGINLQNYTFVLQGNLELEPNRNLVDQCVQGEGIVQINLQIQNVLKRINIIDVLKPAEDYVQSEESKNDQKPLEEESGKVNNKKVLQWQVDLTFKKEQERLKIPFDPKEWTTAHVRHWLLWAVRQFNLSKLKLSDWNLNGEQLCELTMQEFKKIVPNDPDDVFWIHLQLLRTVKSVAIIRHEEERPNSPKTHKKFVKEKVGRVTPHYPSTEKYFDKDSNSPNKSLNNGQIQLWQFLLELLTSVECKSIIEWVGSEGEFKLSDPEVVAKLWGERKNKPTMNYEKLSRALRYYYDGDMICKVHGKRFVYKFVCDLKQLLGYSAVELSNLVNNVNS